MNPVHTRFIRPFLALAAAVGLSACASTVPDSYDNAFDATSRSVPVDSSVVSPTNQVPVSAPLSMLNDLYVTSVNVTVPETLKVSEANRFYPGGDIVWREDPIGNRHEQVKAIMEAGLNNGVSGLNGTRAVELDVVVSRFHALTEKARYTTGGVHAIQFTLQIRDAETGVIVSGPKKVIADFGALGGRAAIQAEANGITQKVRITNQLAHVIQTELTRAEGYIAKDNGFLGAINQL